MSVKPLENSLFKPVSKSEVDNCSVEDRMKVQMDPQWLDGVHEEEGLVWQPAEQKHCQQHETRHCDPKLTSLACNNIEATT